MSLTSYRTAPPRVTDFLSRPIRETNPYRFKPKPETTSRPTPVEMDKSMNNRPSRALHPGGCNS